MDGAQLPQGYSHYKKAVYFLPLSPQKFLVHILPPWKDERLSQPSSHRVVLNSGPLDLESSCPYSVNQNISFKTSMLRSYLCGYSDAYIVVRRRISIRSTNDATRINVKLTFNNNTWFRPCISKINSTFVGNAEDLDISC